MKKYLIIIGILFLSLPCLFTVSTKQHGINLKTDSNTMGTEVLANNSQANFVTYSTRFDANKNEVDLFYTNKMNSNQIIFTESSVFSNATILKSSKSQSASTFSSNYSNINYFKYFVSGNISFYYIQKLIDQQGSFDIFLKNSTNNQFNHVYAGNSKLLLITSFNNAGDAYFCLYDTNSIQILKYSALNNTFNQFYSLNKTNGIITSADAYIYNNEIFLLADFNAFGNKITSVAIVDSQGLIYSQDVPDHYMTSFIPYNSGLLFYSSSEGNFYLSTYKYTLLASTLYLGGNYLFIRPFDNSTFLALSSTQLVSFSTNANNYNNQFSYKLTTEINKTYSIRLNSANKNNTQLEAFSFNGSQNYFLSGIKGQESYLIEGNMNTVPIMFSTTPVVSPSSNSSQQTNNSHYSTSVTYPSVYSTISFDTTFPKLGQSQINIIVITSILVLGLISAVYFNRRRKRYRYRPQKNDSSNAIASSANNTSPKQSFASIHKQSFCKKCGYFLDTYDVFCQKCGSRKP